MQYFIEHKNLPNTCINYKLNRSCRSMAVIVLKVDDFVCKQIQLEFENHKS